MIRHLLKLVWNRKRANALLIVEIFFSFLVVFAVATLGLFFLSNYRRPLGFAWRDAWAIHVDMKKQSNDTFDPAETATFARLLQEVKATPGVSAAAAGMDAPFSFESFGDGFDIDGRRIETGFDEVDEGLASVLDLELAQGRWFRKEDSALPYRPVVINARLAREAFGTADPIGKRLRESSERGQEMRVVGVVDDYRPGGELARPKNYAFYFKASGDLSQRPPQVILLRVAPGTTRSLEERLVRRLQAVAPGCSFEVQPLANLREVNSRFRLLPLVVGGIIAFFLLSMVGLGLLGVLWQNVLRRTRELGLRRAVGAARAAVHAQVVSEQLLLTTFGILLGLLLLGQLPFLGVTGFLGTGVFVSGLVVAIVALYLLAVICSLYPSALAGRVQPADALRYE
jgi:putative ABC transport system permease protein